MPIRTIKQSFVAHYSLFIIHYSLSLIIVLLLVTGCSPTKSNSGTLSGAITLTNDTGVAANDPVDFAGVTVALYNPAELDTSLVRINQEFPNLGILIDQETEFDHRLQNPIALSLTSADGSFTMKKIPHGSYNLVILKPGWGVRYFYDVNIAKGKNNLESVISASRYAVKNRSAAELYPERHLSGYVLDEYTFLSNHNYVIDDEISFVGNVIMNSSANIWIASGKRLKILESFGQSVGGDGYSRITSSDSMYVTAKLQPSQIERFDGIYLNGVSIANSTISSVITTFAGQGWSVQTSSLTFSNMIFRNSRVGLQLNQSSNITISNCNIVNNDDVETGGIALTSCNVSLIKDNVFVFNKIGIKQHRCHESVIRNNYFCNNADRDIYNTYETVCLVEHCVFANSEIGIETSGQSNTTVSYCNFQCQTGIFNTALTNWLWSSISANNNNFNCSVYNIKTTARYTGSGTALVFYVCEQNYWYSTISTEIAEKIWDHYDEDVNAPGYYQYDGVVDYQPPRYSREQSAGIVASI